MMFHVPEGFSESIFEGSTYVELSAYEDKLNSVFKTSSMPFKCWAPPTLNNPFNSLKIVEPGSPYHWNAKVSFDIIT